MHPLLLGVVFAESSIVIDNCGIEIGHSVEFPDIDWHIVLLSRTGSAPAVGDIRLQQGEQLLDLVRMLGLQVTCLAGIGLHVVKLDERQTRAGGVGIVVSPTA